MTGSGELIDDAVTLLRAHAGAGTAFSRKVSTIASTMASRCSTVSALASVCSHR
jgi:hypothetical protein